MFTSEVIDQLNYYVYRLIDPRTGLTFYVGKGKGNRLYAHINDALKNYNGKSYVDKDEDEISAKIKQIRAIKDSGLEVIHIIQRYGMSEKEALEVEAALIDCYPGLTNIKGGLSPDRGVCNADLLQQLLSYEEFEDQSELRYCIIKITDNMVNERGSIYETVRKYWKVNIDRINKIPYVLASLNGVVVDVFEVKKWYESPDCPGRCMFDGKKAPKKISSLFVKKRLPKQYMKKGMASPVLYHD